MEILFYPYRSAKNSTHEKICVRVKKSGHFDLKISLPLFVPQGCLKKGKIKTGGCFSEQLIKIKNELAAVENFIIENFSKSVSLTTKEAKTKILNFLQNGGGTEETIVDLYKKCVNERDLQATTRKSTMVLCNYLTAYEVQTGKKITLENFTRDFVAEFLLSLQSGERGENCLRNYYKNMRTFCIWLFKKGYTKGNLFENIVMPTEKYGTPYYLTEQERKKIIEAELPAHLEKQRDVFIFQCCVGCRVGDLIQFTKNNINGEFLEYIPNKTKYEPITVRVPLNKTAMEILKKYERKDDVNILPVISPQKYNEAIKEIAKRCGLNRKIQVLNPRTGKQETKILYNIISSHCARRTFIGTLYKKTKDVNIISSMSGHVENSKAFIRYRAIDDEDKRKLIDLIS